MKKKELAPADRTYLIDDQGWSNEQIDAALRHGWFETDPASPWGPGIKFNWKFGEQRAPQIRPRKPVVDKDGKTLKYLFKKGQDPRLWQLHPNRQRSKVLCIEGSKQCILAAQYAPDDYEVFGVAGCRNWSKEGLPILDLRAVAGKDVVVGFDGDAASNSQVYASGEKFAQALVNDGARSVRFMWLVGKKEDGDKTGLDDDLLRRKGDDRDDQCRKFLANLIEQAEKNALQKNPAKRRPSDRKKKAGAGAEFFDGSQLLTEKLTIALLDATPAALTFEDQVAVYRDGCFVANDARFTFVLSSFLHDFYSPAHEASVKKFALGQLDDRGQTLPDRTPEPLLNLRNGMLDLRTGQLLEWDPKYLSGVQLPVEWDEQARCPTYERWLDQVIPEQIDDLEEVASTMLDRSQTPRKAIFVWGRARSGKSTFLNLLAALAGEYQSAVTLHQFSSDPFSTANVYGKILNVAADLSSRHVDDLSSFKMMTGGDRLHANRKWGQQFGFTNQALLAFSANNVPTVSESSRAYAERIKPFKFDNTFAGKEDPSIAAAMMKELPGILVRLVHAWQRFTARNSRYLPTPIAIQNEFEEASNRVQRWLASECVVVHVVPTGAKKPRVDERDLSTKTELTQRFNLWAQTQYGMTMNQKTITDHLLGVNDVIEVRDKNNKQGLNIRTKTPDELLLDGTEDLLEEGGNGGRSGPISSTQKHIQVVDVKTTRRNGSEPPPVPPVAQPHVEDVMIFDLETGSATELHSAGPEWLRLGGYAQGQGTELTTDFADLTRRVQTAKVVTGHNVMGYDLLALARHHGLDILELTRRNAVFDTLLAARHVDPPMAREKGRDFDRRYDLDSLGAKYGLGGKSGDLKGLAKEFGGFDQIPTEDERYRSYLVGDVELSQRLYLTLHELVGDSWYLKREHRVAAIAASITLNGFRVDLDLLSDRLTEGAERKNHALNILNDHYDIPLTDAKGQPYLSPLATKAGKAALCKAFEDRGAGGYWVTGKTEDIATSREAMRHLALQHMDKPAVVHICKLVTAIVTTRSVYSTVEAALVGERVHPSVTMKQSTGRWSLSKPGMTVMGKRGQRYHEREVFIADEGQVILAVDLSQVDMRALAGLSGDPDYIAMLGHEDPHAEIARALFGDPGKRDEAKTIGHGWNYGRGIKAISDEYELDPALVRQFDRSMRERFPRLVAWQDEVREIAGSGDLLDNGWGRKMRPEPMRAHTQGPALMGQGCARDLMMEGLLRLPNELLPMLRCQVHDEIILSVPAADAREIQDVVIESLSFDWEGPGGTVPIVATGGPADRLNWGDCYRK